MQQRRVELFADRTRALPIVDPEDRELTISCGAALCQLRLAIRHFGFTDVVELLPNTSQAHLLARITLGEARSSSAEEERFFLARRHSGVLSALDGAEIN